MTQSDLTIPDFHTHVLPGIDDGSADPAESRAMLDEMARQGIRTVVATPHFYPKRDNLTRFFAKRAAAVEALANVYDPQRHPTLYLGAEVAFWPGIGRSSQLQRFCIEGTRYVLIEMPFFRWTPDILEELDAIREELDLLPVLAHVERYLRYQKRGVWELLANQGFLLQANADFFMDRWTEKKALRMLSAGQIHLLGSDSHNMAQRKPNLGDAVTVLRENQCSVLLEQMAELGAHILADAAPVLRNAR